MSVILYQNDSLYADSLFETDINGQTNRHFNGEKLFIDDTGRIAVAITGVRYEHEELAELFKLLDYILTQARVSNYREFPKLTEEQRNLVLNHERSILVMTSETTLGFKYDIKDKVAVVLRKNDFVALGAAGHYVNHAIRCGLSGHMAITVCMRHSSMLGGEIKSIPRKILLPFGGECVTDPQ